MRRGYPAAPVDHQRALVDITEVVRLSFAPGLGAILSAPVGVSAEAFSPPIQLTVVDVPSPTVAPTNLLFNSVAVPRALARYRA